MADILITGCAPGAGWLPTRSALPNSPGPDLANSGSLTQGLRILASPRNGAHSKAFTCRVASMLHGLMAGGLGSDSTDSGRPPSLRSQNCATPSWVPDTRPWSAPRPASSIRDLGFEAQDGRTEPPPLGSGPRVQLTPYSCIETRS